MLKWNEYDGVIRSFEVEGFEVTMVPYETPQDPGLQAMKIFIENHTSGVHTLLYYPNNAEHPWPTFIAECKGKAIIYVRDELRAAVNNGAWAKNGLDQLTETD